MSAEGDNDIEVIQDNMGDPTLYTAQPIGQNRAAKRRRDQESQVSSSGPPAVQMADSLFLRKMREIKGRNVVGVSGMFSSRAMFPLVIAGVSAKQSLSDVQIICENKTFNCHRAILAQHSTTFHTMFTGDFAEAGQGPVQINEITGDIMLEILRFIYCGYVEVDVTNASQEVQYEFIYAAEKYHVNKLIGYLMIAFNECLSAHTACRFLIWADRFRLELIKNACFGVMAKHANNEAVIASTEWQEVLASKQLMTELYRFMSQLFL